MAVASLVLGIISLVWALVIPAVKIIAIILGVIGIILGALGRKDPERKGIATAGLVLSILGLIFGIITWIACVGAVAGCASALDQVSDSL